MPRRLSAPVKIGITGLPGSGKTQTLLRIIQLLEEEGLKVGGMVTEPIVVKQRRVGFQITNWITKEHEVFAHEGLKSRIRSGPLRGEPPRARGTRHRRPRPGRARRPT